MTGVEILATEEVVTKYAFNWPPFFITFGVILFVYVLVGTIISAICNDWDNLRFGSIIGAIMGVIFGIIVGFGIGTPTALENQYKVTVSDEVSMVEFMDKYEIIEQEGKIYTVREN